MQFLLLFIRGKFSTIFKADQRGAALIEVCVHVCVCLCAHVSVYVGWTPCNPRACPEFSTVSLHNVMLS